MAQPSTPLPTPEAISVAVTPALHFIASAPNGVLYACVQENPHISLNITETYANAPNFRTSQISLHLGAPSNLRDYAAQLGTTEIIIVLNPKNQQASLLQKDLKDIFTGKIRQWEQVSNPSMNGSIQVWTYSGGDESSMHFERVITSGLPVTTLAKIAPDPNAMLQAITADPAAIGFLPKPWLNASVRRLQVDANLQQALTLPILSLSAAEPQGASRMLLGCVQNKLKSNP